MEDKNQKKSQKSAKSSQHKELEQKIDELTEALQRERADAVNVRRRAEEDRIKMAGYYKAQVVKELLTALDNFDRAMNSVPVSDDTTKAMEDWLKGLNGIHKQLGQALDSLGVRKIKTVGEEFDPKYHEAVQMDSESEGSREVVVEELMSGYTIDDEVLRHAMVKVALQ